MPDVSHARHASNPGMVEVRPVGMSAPRGLGLPVFFTSKVLPAQDDMHTGCLSQHGSHKLTCMASCTSEMGMTDQHDHGGCHSLNPASRPQGE